MAHFALVEDGKVVKVHVLANEVITGDDGLEHESLGQQFLADLYGYDLEQLVQCSYNGNIRGLYPAPGWDYDEARDAFIPPQPYDSWVLDDGDTHLWVAPVPMPEDGKYVWDEESLSWRALEED